MLPPVCVVSGAPADRLYRFRFRHTSAWLVLFLLLGPVGIVVLVLVVAMTQAETVGYLPMSDAARARGRSWRRYGVALCVAGVAVAVFGNLVDGSRPVWIFTYAIGAALLTFGAVLVLAPPGSVRGRPDRVGRWVHMRPVSTEFIDAYAAQEERRIARRREAAGVPELI